MKKLAASFTTLLALGLSSILLASCGNKSAEGKPAKSKADGKPATYTYRFTSTAPSTWSPTDWTYGAEGTILENTSSPLYEFMMNEEKTGHDIVCNLASALPLDVTRDFAGKAPFSVPEQAENGWAWKIDIIENACWEDGTPITVHDIEYSLQQFLNPKMKNYRASIFYQDTIPIANALAYYEGTGTWENVGFIADGDYSFTLVLEKALDPFMAVYSLSSIYLVKEDLYETNKIQTGDIVKSSYGTSAEKYCSYGPYKITFYQAEKSIHLERNEKWFGWTDGKRGHDIQTTGIDIQFIAEHATIMNLFLQGKLDAVELDAADLEKYGNSEYRSDTPVTHTAKISFNIDKASLKRRESPGVNHSIISYTDFRHAFSLAIDRQKYIETITPASEAGYGIINKLYISNPETNEHYRESEQAKNMLCEFYGTKTESDITGYDKDEARKYLEKAYSKALAAGDIKAGDKVVIDVHVYTDSPTNKRTIAFMQEAMNAAAEGTALENKIFLNTVTDEDYYNNMKKGNVDLAYTLWGGNAFNPYALLQCYCDPDVVNEYGFKPKDETVTINIEGKNITKTYYDWYIALNMGEYTASSYDIKNTILSQVERGLLETYCMIPYRYMQTAALDSQRIINGSDHYINPLVGFGQINFMRYSMSDQEWDEYCRENNNHLIY